MTVGKIARHIGLGAKSLRNQQILDVVEIVKIRSLKMKPINFKEQNTTYTKPQGWTDEECGSLPTYQDDGQIISCWKMSFRERLKALLTGIIWLDIGSFSQPPVWLGVESPFVIPIETDNERQCCGNCKSYQEGSWITGGYSCENLKSKHFTFRIPYYSCCDCWEEEQ